MGGGGKGDFVFVGRMVGDWLRRFFGLLILQPLNAGLRSANPTYDFFALNRRGDYVTIIHGPYRFEHLKVE